MTIVLTGSSGFLGRIIQHELQDKNIISIARKNADIICDLSLEIPEVPKADLVIHAAGKAHLVPKNKIEEQEFYDTNVQGTKNLLKGLERNLPGSLVFISSVAVYGAETGENINEDMILAAKDAYGLSKIQAEKVIGEWCGKNRVKLTILRLPLLIGSNAPGNFGAMVKGIQRGYYLNIAGGKTKRSMVLARNVANIICRAAETGGIFNLTDGYHPSFYELSERIASRFGKAKPFNVPRSLILPLAKLGDALGTKFPLNSKKLNKMLTNLTFSDEKAKRLIGWCPEKVLDNL